MILDEANDCKCYPLGQAGLESMNETIKCLSLTLSLPRIQAREPITPLCNQDFLLGDIFAAALFEPRRFLPVLDTFWTIPQSPLFR